MKHMYRARRQDVALEKERNYAAGKQSQEGQSNQWLIRFSSFPVQPPVFVLGSQ